MPLPADLPVVDHHCHLSPTGEGVAAARRFRRAGGTHLFLATQSYEPVAPTTLEGYRAQFETTEKMGRAIRADSGVVVYPVVAPYPWDLVPAVERLGREAAVRLHFEALDLAGQFVRDGRAVALGEVGRPHMPVPEPIADAASAVLVHALEVARDVGCPAVVHSEDLDAAGYRRLAEVAGQVGLPTHRLVKHYARSRIARGDAAGVVPSYLARRELVRQVVDDPASWFLETDFLDDRRRPGAVLDLETVPRRAAQIAAGGAASLERLRIPFEESVRAVYGFTIAVPEERAG